MNHFSDCSRTSLARYSDGLDRGRWQDYWFRVPPSETITSCRGLFDYARLDLQARAGQVVDEPSIHPQTGREYVWTRHIRSGIAERPGWFLQRLLPDRNRVTIPLPDDVRSGRADALAADLIARFPVPNYGCRNDQMVKCVASVIGRGYDDATVIRAVSWRVYFHEHGQTRSSPSKARTEILETIAVLRSSPRFGRAIGGRDHREACRQIVLTGVQTESLKGLILGPKTPNTKSPTH